MLFEELRKPKPMAWPCGMNMSGEHEHAGSGGA